MPKQKILYCWKCEKSTKHTYVCKETMGDGLGLARGILAVCSLGVSETVGAYRNWECTKCGHIVKE